MGNIIILGHAKIWKDQENIVYFQFNNCNPNNTFDVETAKKIESIFVTLSDGQPVPLVIDLRGFCGTFSRQAASWIATSNALGKIRISETYLVNSIGTKLLIASYKRIYDPITPHIITSDLSLAEKYCKESKVMFFKKYEALQML